MAGTAEHLLDTVLAMTGRRRVLALGIGAALAPMCFSKALHAASPAVRFSAPAGPMLYSRKLVREMAGGFSLTTERSFAIRFEATEDGFFVAGQQLSVRVDAPAKLADFARLEEQRVEDGIFPLVLDRAGHILRGAQATDCREFDAAVLAARAALDRQAIELPERVSLRDFINTVQKAAASLTSALPADIFAPVRPYRSESREVPMPDGGTGVMQLEFEATAEPETGLLRSAERRVITRIAQEQRRTLESWRLSPA